jgi:hypothetical protein
VADTQERFIVKVLAPQGGQDALIQSECKTKVNMLTPFNPALQKMMKENLRQYFWAKITTEGVLKIKHKAPWQEW